MKRALEPALSRSELSPADVYAHLVARFGQSRAIFVREPLVDPCCPESSDVDVVVLDDAKELLPERHFAEPGLCIDLVRLPASWFQDPKAVAVMGLVPHRLLGSRLVYDPDGFGERARVEVATTFATLEARRRRVVGFLKLGADAVRETGVTRDLPGLARFWVHMAFSSLVCSLAEGFGRYCPNAYTRPFDWIPELERESGIELVGWALDSLALGGSAAELEQPLVELHRLVTRRFPEPEWPARMRQCTRYEYRYFSSARELEYRLAVARELSRVGAAHASVFYLRFWAWMLTCIPLVHARAREGIDVSFLRPQRAVGPDLAIQCPAAVPLLRELMGVDAEQTEPQRSVAAIVELRRRVLACLDARGLSLQAPPRFEPFEPNETRSLNPV